MGKSRRIWTWTCRWILGKGLTDPTHDTSGATGPVSPSQEHLSCPRRGLSRERTPAAVEEEMALRCRPRRPSASDCKQRAVSLFVLITVSGEVRLGATCRYLSVVLDFME